MERTIKPQDLKLAGKHLIDVRRAADRDASTEQIPGARWHDPEQIAAWAGTLPKDREIVLLRARRLGVERCGRHPARRRTRCRIHRGRHGSLVGCWRGGKPTASGASLPPNQALDALRTVLTQNQIGAAVIVRYGDKLFGDPNRQSPDELQNLIRLKKMLNEAADLAPGHPLVGRKNALVLVANQLGDVPPWLYHNDPLTAFVQVAAPGKEERTCFFRRFHRNFFDAADLPAPQLEDLMSQLADLTDGLTAWDLDGIRRTSATERISIDKPRELVDYYKYGSREDFPGKSSTPRGSGMRSSGSSRASSANQ